MMYLHTYQICGKSALKMTYGEAMDLMSKYNSRGRESVLTVKTNKEGELCTLERRLVGREVWSRRHWYMELGYLQ